MGVPASEVGYAIATTRRETTKVHKNMWWHWGVGGTCDYTKHVWSVRPEKLKAMLLKSWVFWEATPLRPINNYRKCEGAYCIRSAGTLFANWHGMREFSSRDYKTLYPGSTNNRLAQHPTDMHRSWRFQSSGMQGRDAGRLLARVSKDRSASSGFSSPLDHLKTQHQTPENLLLNNTTVRTRELN